MNPPRSAGMLRVLKASIWAFLVLAPAVVDAQESPNNLARDLTIGQRPIWEFTQQQAANTANWAPARRLDVDAWVDRQDQTYHLGQPLTVSVRPRTDSYITILNYGTSGRMTMVFPNQFQQDNRVRAGRTVQVPPPGAPFRLASAGPAGVELLQVLASNHPLSLPELAQLGQQQGQSPFVSLGRSGADVARDLVLQMAPPSGATPDGQAPVSKVVMLRVISGQVGMLDSPPPGVMPIPGLQADAGAIAPIGGMEAPLVVRTDKNVYRTGEAVQVTVAARQPCTLTLLTAGPSGLVSRLFPNPQQPAMTLMPGQVLMVPPPNATFQVVAGSPTGIETVLGICSHADDANETVFQQVLTQRSAQATPRDLALVAQQPNAVEGQAAAAYFVTQ